MTLSLTLRPFVALLVPVALAACGTDARDAAEESTTAAAPESMSSEALSAEMKKAVRPLPGQYTSTSELVELDMPGLPPEQVARMKQMMGTSMSKVTSRCLTEEEASKGFEDLAGETQDNCRMESFNAEGGAFSGRMVCSGDGGSGTMTMNGTGTPTGSDMVMAMDMTSPNVPGGRMAVKMHVISKRTGDCEG